MGLCNIILSQVNQRSKNEQQQQPSPHKCKTDDKDVKVFLRLTVRLWILALESQAIYVCMCVWVICICTYIYISLHIYIVECVHCMWLFWVQTLMPGVFWFLVWCFEGYLIEPGVCSFRLADQGVPKSHVPLLSPSSGVQEVYPCSWLLCECWRSTLNLTSSCNKFFVSDNIFPDLMIIYCKNIYQCNPTSSKN